jgi:hypothetical protein
MRKEMGPGGLFGGYGEWDRRSPECKSEPRHCDEWNKHDSDTFQRELLSLADRRSDKQNGPEQRVDTKHQK